MTTRSKANLVPTSFPELKWDNDAAKSASVEAVRTWAIDHAKDATDWYINKKEKKHFFARYSRLLAIVLAGVAGVFPVIGQIFGTASHPYLLNPAWSTVFVAIVAAIIGLDRFMGWSSSWARFLVAATEIRLAKDEFEFQWQEQLRPWSSANLGEEQVQRGIALAGAFVSKVNLIVREETATWIVEFQSIVRQLDESIKLKPDAASPPALNIAVTNGDQCDAPGWTLIVDTGQSFARTGKSAALVGLPAGNRVFSISGKIQGKIVSAEKATALLTGNPVALEVTLA